VHVFHLIKSLGRGGAEMLLPEGLRFADRDRFHYSYGYFLPWKDAMAPALRAQGVRVTCIPANDNVRILLAARRLAGMLRHWEVDVVHCHLPVAGVVGRIAGQMAGVPVVYTEHNKQERYHWVTRRLNLSTWRMQERVIAVSADVATSIAAHVRSRVPVQVVLNGVDVEHFRRAGVDAATVRTRFAIPASAPVVGTVAVFRAQKRLEDWLEAARQLLERHPGLHFLLVGDGPLREEVMARASALGLTDRVHFPGLQEDVRPYLAAMDVYLMSSAFEGLPVALLEAMSMECVPVCTAVGGIPELVAPGHNGALSPPGDPTALAQRAGDVLSDTTALRALGAGARRTVEERFGMGRMTRELEDMYLQVTRGSRHAG